MIYEEIKQIKPDIEIQTLFYRTSTLICYGAKMDKLDPIEIDPKTFLRQHFSLPALPKVVTEVQEVMQSDNVSVSRVVDIIQKDPALVAQILKIVNSAYYSFTQEISNIKFAVAYLGLHQVFHILLSFSVIDTLVIKEKSEMKQFWFHSFYTALCSKLLEKRLEPLLSFDELWSAAILHDIGKLVYLKFFPIHYKALKEYCNKNGSLFSEAEKHFSLPASAYLGTLLCDRWHLPVRLRDACECHGLSELIHLSGNRSSDIFKRIICLANLFACLSTNELNHDLKGKIIKTIMAAMNLSEEQFLTFMGEIYALKLEVENLNKWF